MNQIKSTLIILFILLGFFLHAEIPNGAKIENIDSLRQTLNFLKDESKYKTLMQLSNKLFSSEPEECIKYLTEALSIAKKSDNLIWEADAKNRMGSCYYILGKFNEALEYYFSSLKTCKNADYKQGIAKVSGNIGLVYDYLGEFNKSLKYHLSSLETEESLNNKEGIAASLNNIGNVYYSLKNYDEALSYFQKSLRINQVLENNEGVSHAFNNIGIIYHEKKNNDKSLLYLQSALVIFIESNNYSGMASCYNNIGRVYSSKKNYKSALENFKKAYEINEISGKKWGMANNLQNIGNTYLQLKKYNSAKENFDKALIISEDINAKSLLSEIHRSYSDFYFVNNNYENALNHFKMYSDLRDTIYSQETTKKISDLQKSYEISKKEKENEILIKDNEISNLLLTRSRNFQILIAVTLLLVLILIVIIYKRYLDNKKRNILLAQKSKEVEIANTKLHNFNDKLENKVKERTKAMQEEINEREKADIDRKKALKTAEDANYLKNAFLANMSHEIRTPLNGIIGFSSLLETELSIMENEELYEYAKGIQQSGDRLMHLLNNIIDISRIEANDMEVKLNPCFINEIMENVCEIFRFNANEKKLKFNTKFTELPEALADESYITKIVSDVIDNAIKYTNSGFINIATEYDKNLNQILITIKDTGIGIDKAYLNHIFEAFRQESSGYSRTYQGAGLGLPLAEKLIKLMDGDIKIDSIKGKGTTVILFLNTYKEGEIITTQEMSKKEDTPIKTKTNEDNLDIFFVEDDRMNRIVLKKMLTKVGKCTDAVDGDETLNIIEKAFNKGKVFDIMIFDINLPTPWDGIKLMKEIKKRWKKYKNIPFIALTAYAMSGDKERFIEAGFDNYIAKPVNKARLINMINNQMMLRNKEK
ncbi:MAG: tetratricopeptide repeat protein [Bacteroidales bacterium]|nr:tetratricopeptide repeat protein [Bacteroidales bacterium]